MVSEPSPFLAEGVRCYLEQWGYRVVMHDGNPDTLEEMLMKARPDFLILTSSFALYRAPELRRIRKDHPGMLVFGWVQGTLPVTLQGLFDELLYPEADARFLKEALGKKIHDEEGSETSDDASLSERETHVLSLLVKGMSNKAIADALSLSIHTVNSHRRNITEKTGIRSLSGLTIFALTRKLVNLEDF